MKALEGYELRIQKHGTLLEEQIACAAGEPIDVSKWFYFLSFDVMGDFAFAKSFNMLESKDWHYSVTMLRRALNLLGPLSSVPWLVQLAFSFPIIPIVRDWNKMVSWCSDRMKERVLVSSALFLRGWFHTRADVLSIFRPKWINLMYAKSTVVHPQVPKTDLCAQISSWLIEGSKKQNSLERDRFWLDGDSVALIVAGRQVLPPRFLSLKVIKPQ